MNTKKKKNEKKERIKKIIKSLSPSDTLRKQGKKITTPSLRLNKGSHISFLFFFLQVDLNFPHFFSLLFGFHVIIELIPFCNSERNAKSFKTT